MRLRTGPAMALLLGAAAALAAGRTPYGGELRLAHLGPAEPGEPGEPTQQDSPLEATLLGLRSPPVCRLDAAARPVPALARELSRPLPQVVHLTLASPEHAAALARAWARLAGAEAPSPYRALLYPLRAEGRQLAASGNTLELPLAFPWPDMERSLCHPALAPPPGRAGPFAPAGPGTLEAQPTWPAGRPYLERLLPTATDERGLSRLWAARQAQVVLGVLPEAGTLSGPALYATYLSWVPRRLPADFRQAVESAVDREDLTRLFVRGPAVAMPHLLPPALLEHPARPQPAPPAPRQGLRVELLYEAGNEDQRAVAERLQVRLHERGYALALQALPRAALRERLARREYEVALQSLLLPPVPGPALAVVLEAAGRRDMLGVELSRIGAVAQEQARQARVRERALALEPTLPLLPLFAQGLAVRAAPEVGGLGFDLQGLLVLESAWLQPPGAMGDSRP